MSLLQSPSTATGATVDPTSNALRVTRYNTLGQEMSTAPVGSYMVPVRGTPAGGTGGSLQIWISNSSPSIVLAIRRIYAYLIFRGTAAAGVVNFALFKTYTLEGGSSSGAQILTPAKKKSSYGASVAFVANDIIGGIGEAFTYVELVGAGLIATNVTGKISEIVHLRFDPVGGTFPFFLRRGEGLLVNASPAPPLNSLGGTIEWDEHDFVPKS